VSMVSVKAGAEGARVGVSGLGLPAVVYGLCEGWCRGCKSWCQWVGVTCSCYGLCECWCRSCRSCCKLGKGFLLCLWSL
jgi:hypothetical protein